MTAGTWGSLATTKYDVIFHGLAAHAGGYPEKGSNALLAAAEAVLALHAIPRHSGGQSRVNVGVLHAGTGRNVVPDRASMQVEVRGETTEINAYMAERCEAICRGAAQMQGCTVDLVKVGEAEGQHSDLPLIERIDRVLAENLPELRLSSIQNAQNWGSEDISIMMNRVQAHGGQATEAFGHVPELQHDIRIMMGKGDVFHTGSSSPGPGTSDGGSFFFFLNRPTMALNTLRSVISLPPMRPFGRTIMMLMTARP